MTRYRVTSFLRKEMLVVLLTTATLASYADRYILNPGGHMFATFASYDLTIATSSDVINVLPSGLCEETPSIVPQKQSYIQSLIHEREALRTKKEVLQKFSHQAPKAIMAMDAIQQKIDEIESKIQQAPILYDIVDTDLTS